ncbi:uncharacterized protein CXorf38 homolog [Ruditapes philippinarum]|uniref:uncharacterized protein CXorf38 homolog n=1 Tax=Ruditapes philippinarum TaxID=129788 RepID=UPI00295B5934|nr:uncharacterized protein CXorf38 homolog [Ruditapes philippinarum]
MSLYKKKSKSSPLPFAICSKMYDCIVCDHFFTDPLWSNTDPRKWCSDPWSIAKAYQSTIGQNTSAKDTDASGLLSIIINDTTFTDKLRHPVKRGIDPENNIYCKARTARNDILHSPKMKLDEAKMLEYIDLFSDVLKDIKGLLEQDKAMRAYKALEQLKSADIHISSEDENKIRKLRENAINDIELEKQNALTAIKEAADQENERIKSNASTVVNKLDELSDYENTKSDFVKDLISFNKRHHSTIPVSPLFDFRAADLVEFYVIPELKYVDVYGELS